MFSAIVNGGKLDVKKEKMPPIHPNKIKLHTLAKEKLINKKYKMT